MVDVSTSKWPSFLAVMRHAESLATERRRHLEQINSGDVHLGLDMRDVDVPLTPEGREHARLTGRRLNEWGPFDVLYVSPYMRTLQTAEVVLGELLRRPAVIKEERLREKEWGVLEGLTKHGIRLRHPDEHERRKRVGKYFYRPPGGESYADVNLRVHSVIGTLLERMDEEDILTLDRQDEARPASLLVYELGERDGRKGVLVRRHWNLVLYDPPAVSGPATL